MAAKRTAKEGSDKPQPKTTKAASKKTSAKKTAKKAAKKTANTSGGKAAGRSKRTPPAPTTEQIAQRAYQLYLERGCVDGYAEQDWKQAERELQAGP